MNLKGYVSVRLPVPVSVQNLVLRDYCARNGHTYFLADVEYIFGGYAMLENAMSSPCDGVLAYSMFMAPKEKWKGVVHFALENYRLPENLEECLVAWAIKESNPEAASA